MKSKVSALILFSFLSFLPHIFAGSISVIQTSKAGSFPLVASEKSATRIVDPLDAEVVTIVAKH